MAKRWDSTLKMLVGEAPQDLVGWLKQGTQFEAELSPHLGSRNVDADILYRVHYAGHPCIFHVEFQKKSHPIMPKRLWEYNTLASLKYKLPVYSVVIYLKKKGTIIEAPHTQVLPWGEEVQRFSYRVIKLWEIPATAILDSEFEGLLPLVPLTANGLQHEAIEQVIARLNPADDSSRIDALSLTYIVASLEYTHSSDMVWLRRRFAMLDELLRESWVYKEWRQEAEEEVTKQVTKQVTEQVTKQVKKQDIIAVVQARFASLTELAQERIERMTQTTALQQLLVQIAKAQDEDEARQILLSLHSE